MTEEFNTKFANVAATSLTVSRIGLGTWAIGGWMWGGTDEEESVKTIRAAVERGITLIDTAPAYGFGRSEEIVGRALADAGLRSRVVIATKVGLEWKDGKVHRNASRNRILREATDSLQRLNSDYIDIYQVHWPDPLVPIEETAEAMQTLFDQGKIRAIGVSNFSVAQIERFRCVLNCTSCSRPTICSSARSRSNFCPIAGKRSHDLDLWRAVPRSFVQQAAGRCAFRRRRSSFDRPEIPVAALCPVSDRGPASRSIRPGSLRQAGHSPGRPLAPRSGRHNGIVGSAPSEPAAAHR